jgi:hypothetical protein
MRPISTLEKVSETLISNAGVRKSGTRPKLPFVGTPLTLSEVGPIVGKYRPICSGNNSVNLSIVSS